MKKRLIAVAVFFLLPWFTYSQFGLGTTGGIDFYQRYTNPADDIAYSSAGNILLNIVFGPRVWAGAKNASISVEVPFDFGLTTLAIKDFKGLGSFAVPVIAKVNFGALSGFYPAFGKGISIGAGIQWSRTELLLKRNYKNKGVERKFFKTYIIELDVGYGSFGTSGYLYLRYGKDFNSSAKTLNFGILVSINNTYVRKNTEYILKRKS